MIDEQKVISSKPGEPGNYEWTYKPTDGVKSISVAVIPQPGGDEVLFALQYTVV